MTLTEEEFKQVKEQLFKQIESFPDEQKQAARQQIEAMNAEQLEEFLIKNNLVKQGDNCLFCSIADNNTPSYKIAENKDSVAVLDINPLSEGQTLIIPKQHKTIEDTPEAFNLAQETAKLLKEKLNVEDIKIESTSVQGHGLINVVPIYKDKKLERKKAEDKELYELQQKLIQKEEPKPEEPAPKPKEIKVEDLPEAPRRIP